MTNAEWMIKNGYKFSDLVCSMDSVTGDIVISLYGKILVRGVCMSFYLLKRWLDKEHEQEQKQILNDTEKKYLSAIIKPFRNRVNYICKANYYNNPEIYDAQHIVIGLDNISPDIVLPLFKSGTMYKGMKAGYVYLLDELGL